MKLIAAFVVICLFPVFAIAQEAEQLAARKELWQEYLEQQPFVFQKEEPGVISSLPYSKANCELRIIVNLASKHQMQFQFVRDGKELASMPGHTESIFRTYDEKLYFANFFSDGPGCKVSAYDLADGKMLWSTSDLSHGRGGGFSFLNLVNMYLSRVNQVDGELQAAAVIVNGIENTVHYTSVLDRETGALLAHKIHGTGFYGDHPIEGDPKEGIFIHASPPQGR